MHSHSGADPAESEMEGCTKSHMENHILVLATSLLGPARQACIRLYSVLFLLRLALNASHKPFQLTKVPLRSFHNLMTSNV